MFEGGGGHVMLHVILLLDLAPFLETMKIILFPVMGFFKVPFVCLNSCTRRTYHPLWTL